MRILLVFRNHFPQPKSIFNLGWIGIWFSGLSLNPFDVISKRLTFLRWFLLFCMCCVFFWLSSNRFILQTGWLVTTDHHPVKMHFKRKKGWLVEHFRRFRKKSSKKIWGCGIQLNVSVCLSLIMLSINDNWVKYEKKRRKEQLYHRYKEGSHQQHFKQKWVVHKSRRTWTLFVGVAGAGKSPGGFICLCEWPTTALLNNTKCVF